MESPVTSWNVRAGEAVERTVDVVVAAGERRAVALTCDVAEGGALTLEVTATIPTGSAVDILVQGNILGELTLVRKIALHGIAAAYVQRDRLTVSGKCATVDDVTCGASASTADLSTRVVLAGTGASTLRAMVRIPANLHDVRASEYAACLLLSPHARARATPEFSCATDDALCNHGVSIAAPDPAQCAYLHARGLSPVAVTSAIAAAFLAL